MLCWSRRRSPMTILAAARWTIDSLCNSDPLIPYRAALPKVASSLSPSKDSPIFDKRIQLSKTNSNRVRYCDAVFIEGSVPE